VSPEDGGDTVQGTRLLNGRRASPRLLSRLQQDHHIAGCRPPRKQVGRSHGPSRVNVVAAGVHHTVAFRSVWKPGCLLDRQRVHVAPQRDYGRSRVFAADPGGHAGARDTRQLAGIQRRQLVLQAGGGVFLREREFGQSVEVVAQVQ
jgi:hypothetical protein